MKIVFLDRDGVINRYPGHKKYVRAWKEFRFLPGVKSALRRLRAAGFELCIISNQAGIAKGIYSKEALSLITRNMLTRLKHSRVDISGVYYCIHHPDEGCACRKPKTGLIRQALSGLKDKKRGFRRSLTYFVGDSIQDVETGKNAGLKTILVFSGSESQKNKKQWKVLPDFTAKDLSEAAKIIIG